MKLKIAFIFIILNLTLIYRVFSFSQGDTAIVYVHEYLDDSESEIFCSYFKKQNIDTLFGGSSEFYKAWCDMKHNPCGNREDRCDYQMTVDGLMYGILDEQYKGEYYDPSHSEIVKFPYGKSFVATNAIRNISDLKLRVKFNSGDCIYQIDNKIIVVSHDITAFSFCHNVQKVSDTDKKSPWINILSGAAFIKTGRKIITFSNDATEKILIKELANVGFTKPLAKQASKYLFPRVKSPRFKAFGGGIVVLGIVLMTYETYQLVSGDNNDKGKSSIWLVGSIIALFAGFILYYAYSKE